MTEPRIFIMADARDAMLLEREAAAKLLELWARDGDPEHSTTYILTRSTLQRAARAIRAGYHHQSPSIAKRRKPGRAG